MDTKSSISGLNLGQAQKAAVTLLPRLKTQSILAGCLSRMMAHLVLVIRLLAGDVTGASEDAKTAVGSFLAQAIPGNDDDPATGIWAGTVTSTKDGVSTSRPRTVKEARNGAASTYRNMIADVARNGHTNDKNEFVPSPVPADLLALHFPVATKEEAAAKREAGTVKSLARTDKTGAPNVPLMTQACYAIVNDDKNPQPGAVLQHLVNVAKTLATTHLGADANLQQLAEQLAQLAGDIADHLRPVAPVIGTIGEGTGPIDPAQLMTLLAQLGVKVG
jgi:hypothetical protein